MLGIGDDEISKKALFYGIRGASKMRISATLGRRTEAFLTSRTYEDYKSKVQEVFHPASERQMVKSEFEERRQGAREDVVSYYSHKYALFAEAYHENLVFDTFMVSAIKGLYSNVVKKKVRTADPGNFEDLRNCILRVVAAERNCYLDGYGDCTSLDGLVSATTVQKNVNKAYPQ